MTSHARFLLCPAFIFAVFVPPGLAQTITEFALPAGGSPYGITKGPDGNLWYANPSFPTVLPKLGRITPAGVVTEFERYPDPLFVATGPDGNLWFTASDEQNAIGAIFRVTPAGLTTGFPQTSLRYFGGIAVGSDGNLWFTWSAGGSVPTMGISRITTDGAHIDFPLPDLSSRAAGIAAGPDGALWFTAPAADRIGRMTTEGVITQFALPTGSEPTEIVAGPDGNLWFTETNANRIGRITTAGAITEFSIPTGANRPTGITLGADGNLWFTERAGNKIGRITTTGVVTEFAIPTSQSEPFGITAGPDGNLWFTEFRGGKIGRVAVPRAPAIDLRILPIVGSAPGVGGSFFRTSVQLHNSTSSSIAGRIVIHPSGQPGNDSDPALFYSLASGQTQSIADLLTTLGLSGLGSADVVVTSGSVPSVTARVFNDAGSAGTTGFTEVAMRPGEAIGAGQRGVLLIPSDSTAFRMNLGVRTLATAVLMTLTVRDAGGAAVATVPKFFPATYHEQQAASVFLNGLPLPAGGSITALVEAGSAILYGATVDNRTGDPSMQIAAPAP